MQEQTISEARAVRSVALVVPDYIGLKPDLRIAEGDGVKLGQRLFEDKGNPGVQFTSPASGWVAAVHRGERRRLLSVVVALHGEDQVQFDAWPAAKLTDLSEERARSQLVASGLWTAFRSRTGHRRRASRDFRHRDGHQSARRGSECRHQAAAL